MFEDETPDGNNCYSCEALAAALFSIIKAESEKLRKCNRSDVVSKKKIVQASNHLINRILEIVERCYGPISRHSTVSGVAALRAQFATSYGPFGPVENRR